MASRQVHREILPRKNVEDVLRMAMNQRRVGDFSDGYTSMKVRCAGMVTAGSIASNHSTRDVGPVVRGMLQVAAYDLPVLKLRVIPLTLAMALISLAKVSLELS